ncbi:hypothetical protein Y032_0461g1877 [Ancylostoma ceylanicum]|nr:hypothetical protein Y032_0461g1877 [Ancylostoma ceylanicum]
MAQQLICVSGSQSMGPPCLAFELKNCIAQEITLGTTTAELTGCRRLLNTTECSCGTLDELNDTDVYERCYDRFIDFTFDNEHCRSVEIPEALMEQLEPRRTTTAEEMISSINEDSTAPNPIEGPQLYVGLSASQRYLLQNATARMFLLSFVMAVALIVQLLLLGAIRRRQRMYHLQQGREPSSRLPSEENKNLSSKDRSTYSNYSIIQSFERALGLAYSEEQDRSTGGMQEMPNQNGSREEPEEHLESAKGPLEEPFPIEPKYSTNPVNAKKAPVKNVQLLKIGTGPMKGTRFPP